MNILTALKKRDAPKKRGEATWAFAFGVVYALAAGPLLAQVVPADFSASPDVYRVKAENDQLRYVEGIWKPGQRDEFHSHTTFGYFWVTDCSLRFFLPDGTHKDGTRKAGTAGLAAPVGSHSVQNVGTSECKIVMFERK